MRKKIAILTVCMAVSAMAGCSSSDDKSTTAATTADQTTDKATEADTTEADTSEADTTTEAEDTTEAETGDETDAVVQAEPMSYDEFMAADVDSEVTVLTYVQGKQSWWEDKATVYTQTEDGAYFLYNMACSEEDYEKLVPGTEILVTGYKAEWSGEIEISDATFSFTESGDTYVAEPVDVTDLLGTEELKNYMNQYVCFNNLMVSGMSDEDFAAYYYKYDNSGSEGDDLYFNVTTGAADYTFTVESYLCGPDTDVYKGVKELEFGNIVNMEGFLYWYEGPNPHITSVECVGSYVPYEGYMDAETDTYLAINAYVQAAQSWWDGKATFYLQDDEGAYFAYNATCSEELYNEIMAEPGAPVIVIGYKAEWAGEIEIAEGGIIRLVSSEENKVYEAIDVTEYLGTDKLANFMNCYVAFNNMEIVATTDGDGNEAAFLYKWDGSGTDGDDLYFSVSDGTNTYSFTVESYLCGPDTDVYEAVKNLSIGDKVNLEGFLYWYEGANPHIVSVTEAE